MEFQLSYFKLKKMMLWRCCTQYASKFGKTQEWPVSQFSCWVMSDSLWCHGLQHTRLPSPSPTTRAYSNSCPLSWWCHPTISSSHPLLLPPSTFPSIRVFSSESVLRILLARDLCCVLSQAAGEILEKQCHVWMWVLNYKESWALKNWCFELLCWRRLLRVPWTARRSIQAILKEISP